MNSQQQLKKEEIRLGNEQVELLEIQSSPEKKSSTKQQFKNGKLDGFLKLIQVYKSYERLKSICEKTIRFLSFFKAKAEGFDIFYYIKNRIQQICASESNKYNKREAILQIGLKSKLPEEEDFEPSSLRVNWQFMGKNSQFLKQKKFVQSKMAIS